MGSRGTAQHDGGRPASENGHPIPEEIDEATERRLAELRPLHDEYTDLLSYRRLVGAPVCGADTETPSRRSSRATTGAARAAILDALAESPKTISELTLELSVIPATLRYNLRRMVRTRVIVETHRGETVTYSLADPGPDGA